MMVDSSMRSVVRPSALNRLKDFGARRAFRWQARLALARIRGIVLPWWWGGVHHGSSFSVCGGVEVSCRNLIAGDHVALSEYVTLLGGGTIELRSGVVLNRGTTIDCHSHVVIGERTLIGPGCYIVDSNHRRSGAGPLVSEAVHSSAIRIGSDVWLGHGVVVLAGVVLGDGATAAAGAVVTRSVPSGAVVAGVPARPIKLSASAVRDAQANPRS